MGRARYDWERIRADYEAGADAGTIAGRHGVGKAAVSRRAKKEGWARTMTGAVELAVDANRNGSVKPLGSEKRAAIASDADGKASVILRHREEWDGQGRLIAEAVEGKDMEAVKLAKLVAETLKIRQEAERKAWGIRDVDAQPDGGALTVRIVRVSGERAAGAAGAAARP